MTPMRELTERELDKVAAGSNPDPFTGIGLKTAETAQGGTFPGSPNVPNFKGEGTATLQGPAVPNGPPGH
jgi:hypothetical protein